MKRPKNKVKTTTKKDRHTMVRDHQLSPQSGESGPTQALDLRNLVIGHDSTSAPALRYYVEARMQHAYENFVNFIFDGGISQSHLSQTCYAKPAPHNESQT